ncbi:Pre-mRNA-splicing factor slt11 [Rhinocladiella similis]
MPDVAKFSTGKAITPSCPLRPVQKHLSLGGIWYHINQSSVYQLPSPSAIITNLTSDMASRQIKQDLNRSGWESTDFPSVCENCLPDNPYVQMIKEDFGAECKICTRPFTVFRWKADRTARTKRTNICLTCARLKNCCQCCMLDLSFGLPLQVRDAALKLVAPGPTSGINREYYAQEHEKELEEGRGAVEVYDKTDEKARDLLRRLANSEPYYKKQRRLEAEGSSEKPAEQKQSGYGPVRTSDSRKAENVHRGPRAGAGRAVPGTARPPQPDDYLPPPDPNITSLFVTGVEDDLPEHAIRAFFTPFGQIRSIVCSHRAHCAFINYATREGAEAAAAKCQGKAVIQGCPLRVRWGKPKPLDNADREQRLEWAREGRQTASTTKTQSGGRVVSGSEGARALEGPSEEEGASVTLAAPPGQGEVSYASMAGD